MNIYRVSYHSMTATYGPQYIEAEDEWAARRKFAGTTLAIQLVEAHRVTVEQMEREIKRRVQEQE